MSACSLCPETTGHSRIQSPPTASATANKTDFLSTAFPPCKETDPASRSQHTKADAQTREIVLRPRRRSLRSLSIFYHQLRHIRHPMSPHQQPVGVHPKGRTGYQVTWSLSSSICSSDVSEGSTVAIWSTS